MANVDFSRVKSGRVCQYGFILIMLIAHVLCLVHFPPFFDSSAKFIKKERDYSLF